MATPTVKVVKGSVDEAILKQQYGNNINYDYSGGNQFSGADRIATNQQYQDALAGYGLKANDAGDLWGYQGLTKGTDAFNEQASQDRFDSLAQGYAAQIQAANNAALQAQQIARQNALNSAFQNNSQALNSQKSNVTNNYNSMANQLNATKEAQLPQYQAQRDAASSDAAAQLRRTQALNALTGKYHSGANRSQMLAVDLAKQGAIGGINQAQNQFETGVQNRLSDADAQRVAALNDIAEKLSLAEQQYNQGTLDLANQIESQKAAGAAQAMADSMKWAQDIQQQGVDNGLRQGQLDLNRDIFSADQTYRDKTFGADQENAAFERALALAGLTGYYDGKPTMAREQFGADQAYRNASLATDNAYRQQQAEQKQLDAIKGNFNDAAATLQGLANQRYTRDQILQFIEDNRAIFENDGIYNDLLNYAKARYQWNG